MKSLSYFILAIATLSASSTGSRVDDLLPDVVLAKDNTLIPDKSICGRSIVNNVVVNSTEAELGEFPWTALLEYTRTTGSNKGTRSFFCAGVLISSRHVLTSAHCVESIPNTFKLHGVRLGEHDLSKSTDCDKTGKKCAPEPLDLKFEFVQVHQMYSSGRNQANNIAVLELTDSVNFTDYIRPICLPIDDDVRTKDFTGERLTAAGFGNIRKDGGVTTMRKYTVPVVSHAQCSESYKTVNVELGRGQMCAGGENVCTTGTDGSLVVKIGDNHYVIGLSSFGPTPCGGNKLPDVFTKVSDYVDWVSDYIRS